jgi:hypothetical protein
MQRCSTMTDGNEKKRPSDFSACICHAMHSKGPALVIVLAALAFSQAFAQSEPWEISSAIVCPDGDGATAAAADIVAVSASGIQMGTVVTTQSARTARLKAPFHSCQIKQVWLLADAKVHANA